MSEFKVNTITNRDGSYGPQVCGITTFGSSGMTLPSGFQQSFVVEEEEEYLQEVESYNQQNVIDKVEIATTGNATDFGDLTDQRRFIAAVR